MITCEFRMMAGAKMFSPSRKAVYFNGKVLPAFNLSMAFLASSLVWGAVGMGMLIYGKRQTSLAALIGALAMMAVLAIKIVLIGTGQH